MISVQFTIAGAPYENIKIRLEGENYGQIFAGIGTIEENARRFFDCYEHLIKVRDMGHQEAVEAVVQGLGAVVVDEAEADPSIGPQAPDTPFWEAKAPSPAAEVFADKKPWERKQPSPEPAAPTAGQSVNLL